MTRCTCREPEPRVMSQLELRLTYGLSRPPRDPVASRHLTGVLPRARSSAVQRCCPRRAPSAAAKHSLPRDGRFRPGTLDSQPPYEGSHLFLVSTRSRIDSRNGEHMPARVAAHVDCHGRLRLPDDASPVVAAFGAVAPCVAWLERLHERQSFKTSACAEPAEMWQISTCRFPRCSVSAHARTKQSLGTNPA